MPHKVKNALIANLSSEDQLRWELFTEGPTIDLSFDQIHHAFEVQAQDNPELNAAEHLGEQISYRNLNIMSELLADHLLKLGTNPGDHIGVFLERSIPMLVSIMGVLKMGGSYVPQDARITPTSQLSHIVDKAQIKVILTLSHLKHRIPLSNGVQIVEVDKLMSKMKLTQNFF